jgi:hypothetical protein
MSLSLSLVSVVCWQVEVSASGRSLVCRRPTECGVCECDREASIIRRRPWSTRDFCAMGGIEVAEATVRQTLQQLRCVTMPR